MGKIRRSVVCLERIEYPSNLRSLDGHKIWKEKITRITPGLATLFVNAVIWKQLAMHNHSSVSETWPEIIYEFQDQNMEGEKEESKKHGFNSRNRWDSEDFVGPNHGWILGCVTIKGAVKDYDFIGGPDGKWRGKGKRLGDTNWESRLHIRINCERVTVEGEQPVVYKRVDGWQLWYRDQSSERNINTRKSLSGIVSPLILDRTATVVKHRQPSFEEVFFSLIVLLLFSCPSFPG